LAETAKNDPDPEIKTLALQRLIKMIGEQRGLGIRSDVIELVGLLTHFIQNNQDAEATEVVKALIGMVNIGRRPPEDPGLVKSLLVHLSQLLNRKNLPDAIQTALLLGQLGQVNAIAVTIKPISQPTRLEFFSQLCTKNAGCAAKVAISLGFRETIPILLQHLSHYEPEVIRALGKLDATEAILPILNILPPESNPKDCSAEIESLSQLGDASTVDEIIKRTRDNPKKQRIPSEVAILTGLGRRNPSWLSEALPRAISQFEWETILKVIAEIKDPGAVPTILSQIDQYPSSEILPEVMAAFQDDRFAPYLINYLTNPQAVNREKAAQALGHLSDPRCVPVLAAAALGNDKKLAEIAIKSLQNQYKNKSISEGNKLVIVNTAASYNKIHTDSTRHQDTESIGHDCTHSDYQHHTDETPHIQL
jgi:hypothetical protein